MNRIYIASEKFGTVTVTDKMPIDGLIRALDQFADEGPALIDPGHNRRASRIFATRNLDRLADEPFYYSPEDLAFFAIAALGCWQKVWSETTTIEWERIEP